MRPKSNRFWAVCIVALQLGAYCILSRPAFSDALVDKNGLLLSGKVLSMEDGTISIDTESGVRRIPVEEITSFKIDVQSGEEPTPVPIPVDQIMLNQQRIAERLDNLALALANIERQIGGVQSTQQVQASRLIERTRPVNSQAYLFVSGAQVVRRGGKISVVGQVTNGSEAPMSNVRVDVYIYGNSGKLGSEGGEKRESVSVVPDKLVPGQTAVFEAQFDGGLTVDNFEVYPRAMNATGYDSTVGNKNPYRRN